VKFDLHQNFPNPFNPSTTLQFDIPYNDKGLTKIDLVIYNNLGQLVRRLYRDNLSAGIFRIRWDGKDDAGNVLPTGLYFAEFRAYQFSKTIRMTLLR
jgi:flagellar hook assembly protein FlgD